MIRDALAAADSGLITTELGKQLRELALRSGRHDLPGTSSDQTAALHALLGTLDPNEGQAADLRLTGPRELKAATPTGELVRRYRKHVRNISDHRGFSQWPGTASVALRTVHDDSGDRPPR
ncbi:hypothetical protein ACSDR0_40855 [Streptosporangium sp. G11]|uniref:hypothetical protein n=1 Tax=Streptosporangium sp. G11 TaxID=3436926 RepID=UPI003EB8899F